MLLQYDFLQTRFMFTISLYELNKQKNMDIYFPRKRHSIQSHGVFHFSATLYCAVSPD